jgi:ABC-type sugar transport system ATPase subunit
MLDLALESVSFRYGDGFAIENVSLTVPRSSHTAIVGPAGCGASSLLQIIAGTLRPESGEVFIGQRRVNEVKASRRPLLYSTSALDVPLRWSVEHALVAAVRTRSLDRYDRQRELRLSASRWGLEAMLRRGIRTLSSTEAARVHLARIELLRPAILVADRILEQAGAAARQQLADAFFRTLRVHGTTVVTAPSSRGELAFTDAIVVMEEGRIVQIGSAAEVFAHPASEAAAVATGEFDAIPLSIRGTTVSSVIGEWDVPSPPFQGDGIALVRPSDFALAGAGEDSDVIFGVEEAGFADGRWIAQGVLTGGVSLRVELPRELNLHKGRLLALRYDPARFRLLPQQREPVQTSVPTDVVPPLRETR